jgi:murein DD-endopeptidase MepM/ murein hydrolase activator NlpD
VTVRRLALITLVLVAALAGSTARADTFTIVSSPLVVPTAPDATATTAPLPYAELLGLWQRAGAAYGVPWQVLASINKIESNFGRNMGPSSAGAIGWMQFMPSTWMRWGLDANGDGVADPWNAADAIFSAARYLNGAGASTDLYRAVFAYNHADWYVNDVLSLADLYASNSTLAFSLDRMQQDLDAARQAVVAAAGSLVQANAALLQMRQRESRIQLLSDRLAFEPAVARARNARNAQVHTLADARAELARAQQASLQASFAPAAANVLGGPSYASGWVFPVGGGPGVVTASHTHHDYPAVDIAAPAGSPVFALGDATVLRAWDWPDPRCGIGLTFQTRDGQTWTYCHLAELDPSVVPGATLAAGQQVGLVGSTGEATGPHLHLQLQPATAWPQQEAWFEGFAGTAFTWSDEPSMPALTTMAVVSSSPVLPRADLAASAAPVFQIVPAAPAGLPVEAVSQSPVVLFSRG